MLADNLKTHTPRGSRLVRDLLSEFAGQLYLVYTPRYDPAANRIEWLWRVVRPAVTHNHQRPTFALLLDDLRTQFQTLSADPAAVLQRIGSPGLPDTVPPLIQPLAA